MPYFFNVISVVGITLNIEKQMGIYDKANKHETRHKSVRVVVGSSSPVYGPGPTLQSAFKKRHQPDD